MTINATTSLVLRPAHLDNRPARIVLRQLPAPVFLKPVQFSSLAILRPRRLVPLCATPHTNTCLYLALSPVCITVSCLSSLSLQICRPYVVRVLAAESIRVTFMNDPVVPDNKKRSCFLFPQLIPRWRPVSARAVRGFRMWQPAIRFANASGSQHAVPTTKKIGRYKLVASNDLIKELFTSASNLPDDQGTKRRRL